MRFASVTILASAFGGVGTSNAAGSLPAPSGVGPADSERYAAALSASSFHCMDNSGTPLPLGAFNDDFCDCADGSDEPGTAACAGQAQGSAGGVLFFCPNSGSRSMYIYHSRVDDSICDCCDGSDEQLQRPRACADTCSEEGQSFREAEERRIRAWHSGTRQQRELLRAYAQSRDARRREAEQLQAGIPALTQERDEAKGLMDEAKLKLPQEPDEGQATAAAPRPDPEEARRAWLAARKAAKQALHRLNDVRAALDPRLAGTYRALAALKGQCFARQAQAVDYRVCFFRYASKTTSGEDKQLLGRWKGWDLSSKHAPRALFEFGAPCGKAGRARLRVTLRCHVAPRLERVEERQACEYEAEMLHPGACRLSSTLAHVKHRRRATALRKALAHKRDLASGVGGKVDAWRSEAEEHRAKQLELIQDRTAKKSQWDALEKKMHEGSASSAAPAAEGSGEGPKVSEYAKWMEGADNPGRAEAAPAPGPAPDEMREEASPPAPPAAAESPDAAAHRRAKAAWEDATGRLKGAKYHLWGLKAGLDPLLSGGQHTYANLMGSCLSKAAGEFEYKVCFFQHAEQRPASGGAANSLGRWMGWGLSNDTLEARFDRGGACGSGARRRLTVSFRCGDAAEIGAVSEPETCAYRAEVLHPGACDAAHEPQRTVLAARLPRDEL